MRNPFFLIRVIFFVGFISTCAYGGEKPYDYVIKDVLIFDGLSPTPTKQNLAISGNRIVQFGQIEDTEAKEVIEADGLIASPGFIDIHTHSDFNPFVYPDLGNKVLQGVTTEVVGNCGMSAAPVTGRHEGEIANVWRREGVQIPTAIPWKSFGDYTGEAELRGLDTNFVGLAGHGNIRAAVMGMEPRQASADEIEALKKLLKESLTEGAWGISFGLTYLPGVFAAREELVSLCREAGVKKGICVFHIRSEGKGLIEAIQEAIDVGRASEAPVHISHLKASGQKNWSKIDEAFQMIEQARREGLKVTADAYPYTAGFAELGVILPDKFYEDPERISRFKDPRKRGLLLRDLRKHYTANPVSWDGVKIATVALPKHLSFQGKSIQEIAEGLNKSPHEVLVELLADEEFQVSAFYFSQSETVMNQVLSKPYVAIGSDSIADGSAWPHPRAFGTFPRILAQCSKEGVKSKNECWRRMIYQMTGLPAKILGLKSRGRLSPGYFADIVLFDPATVRDKADYKNSKVPPAGIRWVFVNGRPVVRAGKYDPVHSGLFLSPEK